MSNNDEFHLIEQGKAFFPRVIDNTIITSWRACKQKCFREHMQGLRPSATSIHLLFGGAFARGIEVARKIAYAPDAPDKLPSDWLLPAVKAIMEYWGDYTPPPHLRTAKSLPNCIAALYDYFETYPPRDDTIKPVIGADGLPHVECTFAIPLSIPHPDHTSEPLLYGGRFDMRGRHALHQCNCVVDEKTTGSITQDWVKQWAMSGQFLGYCWAQQQIGFHIDAVAVRGVGILKTQFKHAEAFHIFPKWQLERWYEDAMETIEEMVSFYRAGHFPRNFGQACTSYGLCPYFDMCSSSRPESWTDQFEIRFWNPLSKDATRAQEESDKHTSIPTQI